MKNFNLKLLATAICLLFSLGVSASDFKFDGLCYNIISEYNRTVEVTHPTNGIYNDYAKGKVIIPERVFKSSTSYTVTKIGDGAFSSCRITNVEIPNTVTEIGEGAFQDCSDLESIEIPNSVTKIGDFAFYRCYMLKSVTFGNSVTEIGDYAFYNCYIYLTSVEFPNSVTKIGYRAFGDCTSLNEVYCKMETPVVADYNVFQSENHFIGNPYEDAVLYVPEGCKEAYEKVDPWRNFWTIEEFDATGISSVTVNGGQFVTVDGGTIKVDNAGGQAVNVYTVGGQCVYSGTDSTISNLAKGVYVVKSGDNVAKIILK